MENSCGDLSMHRSPHEPSQSREGSFREGGSCMAFVTDPVTKHECPNSDTGYHRFIDAYRYDGTSWYPYGSKPKKTEERKQCEYCGHVATDEELAEINRQTGPLGPSFTGF